jgi:integrase
MSKNKKKEEKRTVTSNRGNVELEVRGTGIIHLRFPLSVSQSIFDVKRQKYISLGLTADKEENWQKAKEIQNTAQKDVLDKTVDPSGKKYRADYFYQSIVDLKERTPSTQDLCMAWAEEYKQTISATTYRSLNYILIMMEKAPQNLLDPFSIREWIEELDNAPTTIDYILFILNHAIDWGIKSGKLDESVPNPYSAWKPYLVGVIKKQIPQIAKDKGFAEDFDDVRGFTAEEATEIMEAFKYVASGRYYNLIKFKFLTGCRSGEAFGIKWKDFDEARSILHFRRSYDSRLGETPPKKRSREFPCTDELKEFLLSIRPDNYNNKNYIFQDEKGKLNGGTLWNRWCGQCHSQILQNGERVTYRSSGIIIKLIEAKKISPNYLSPYATRHTFINLQLESGIPPATVASWVGNSPEVIYKYYVSANRKLKPSPIYPSSTKPVLQEEKAHPPLPTNDTAASPILPKLLIHADDDEVEIVRKVFTYRIQDLLNLNAELKAQIKELEAQLDGGVSTTETESTSVSVEPLSGLQLFQRLDIDKSEANWCIFMKLRQNKGAEYFIDWTQHHDAEGIAWEYRQEKLEAPPNPEGYYGTHLAARLGCTETACRTSRYQGSEHFADWSEMRDPEGIAWEYRESTKKYHQLPRRGKYYPVNLGYLGRNIAELQGEDFGASKML